MSMKIEVGTRVLHPDEWTRNEFPDGTVVEVNEATQRARVKWNGVPTKYRDRVRNLRTWVAFKRLAVAPEPQVTDEMLAAFSGPLKAVR